jgi:predicted dehydrogenase
MSNKVKIGFIGSGFARATQAPAFQSLEDANLFAVASPTDRRRERFATEFNIPYQFTDWQDILSCDVDLIVITTPPVYHAEMAIKALESGKHVLCEKPFAMDTRQGEDMLQASLQHKDLISGLDHQLRFHPAVGEMKRWIEEGKLGAIYGAKATGMFASRSSPERRFDWWSQKSYGGGALGAIGSHFIDLFHYLIGQCSSVSANLSTQIQDRPNLEGELKTVSVEDEFEVSMRFNGESRAPQKLAILSGSTVAPYTTFSLEVYGSEGALRISGDGRLWQADRQKAAGGRSTTSSESAFEEISLSLSATQAAILEKIQNGSLAPQGLFGHGFMYLAHELVQHIKTQTPVVPKLATFADGQACQNVMDGVHLSNSEKKWVGTS